MDYRLHIFRTSAAREDQVAAELWRLGCLGLEVKKDTDPEQVRLEVYFPADEEADGRVAAWAADHAPDRLTVLSQADFESRDWLAQYRADTQPFAVGERFFVAPGEPDETVGEVPDGRFLIRVPAQNAFGTGSHESTRLMIEQLEAIDLDGLDVLDVGTGSGILAFAVLKLGAASVVGFDLDPPSVVTASLNGPRNGCAPILTAATAASLKETPSFDLLLVNVLPERVLGDYPRLVSTLRPGGRVLSSGNLLSRRDELLARFAAFGLGLERERAEGEWTSFLLRLGAATP